MSNFGVLSLIILIASSVPAFTVETCPQGSTFDQSQKICIPEAKALCDGISGPMLFPHAECNKYYICLDERPLVMLCEKGYEFDPIFKVCVPISDHGCTASQATSTTQTL